jgi:hypothetical protein
MAIGLLDAQSNQTEANASLLSAIDAYYATAKNDPQPAVPAEAQPVHRLSVNEMHELANSVRERKWWSLSGKLGVYDSDSRFREDPSRYFRYEFPPLSTVIPYVTAGVLLLVSQVFVHANMWTAGGEDMTGLLRLGMIMLGAFSMFMAWPRYRDLRDPPGQDEETEAAHERIAEIIARDKAL